MLKIKYGELELQLLPIVAQMLRGDYELVLTTFPAGRLPHGAARAILSDLPFPSDSRGDRHP